MDANRLTYFTYATPHGPLTLAASERGLVEIVFGQAALAGSHAASALTNEAATELAEYLAGKRTSFDIALDIQASAFQKLVFAEVAAIPYGQTRTPAQIAQRIGKPGAHRSVGTAVKHNKLAPVIPTHRVEVRSAAGAQAKLFRGLVALEKRVVAQGEARGGAQPG